MKTYWVYILASQKNGTLYIGVTNDINRRSFEHKNSQSKFTEKYAINRLVYAEVHGSISEAISREKQLKNWKCQWKLDLINKTNPIWSDLYGSI